MKLLTRDEVIARLRERFIEPENIRVTVKYYIGNPLAPEPVAYRIHFTQFGKRRKTTLWPNTAGFQG